MKYFDEEVISVFVLSSVAVISILAFADVGKTYCLTISWLIFSHMLVGIFLVIGSNYLRKRKKAVGEEK